MMSNLSYEGIGAVVATFEVSGTVKLGQVVKLTGSGQVGLCSAGEAFFGVALEPRAGIAGVQVKGFVTVKGTGLAVGSATLVADGNGGVKAAAADEETGAAQGVSAVVVSVDADGSAVICL